MDKSICIYDSLKEMKAEEYRYWQSGPAHERMSAVAEITLSVHAKGTGPRSSTTSKNSCLSSTPAALNTLSPAAMPFPSTRSLATKDRDLFIKADPANAREVYAGLAAFDVPLSEISESDLADSRKFIRFGEE